MNTITHKKKKKALHKLHLTAAAVVVVCKVRAESDNRLCYYGLFWGVLDYFKQYFISMRP